MIRTILFCSLCVTNAEAEVLVASRTISANSVIESDDILFRDIIAPGGFSDPSNVVGMEARNAIFFGRPILSTDIGIPAVVERNQIVQLIFNRGGIMIKTDGRSLDRAGPGDLVRVMNLISRTTVTARIDAVGVAHVLQ
jgi:flagella basal body P-ring formation protein FlgA